MYLIIYFYKIERHKGFKNKNNFLSQQKSPDRIMEEQRINTFV